MALSLEARAGFSNPDIKTSDNLSTSKINSDIQIHEAIHPLTIIPEHFSKLEGAIQETILFSLLQSGNKSKIDELRPDFQIHRPLEYDEKRFAKWTGEIVSRETPIKVPDKDIDDGLFSQIHHTVYSFNKYELANLLERERLRKIEFGSGLFSPYEDIGRFTAAIRYRGILENKLKKSNPNNP